MTSPDLKTLKKLADACRKAGIKTFEGYGFKFTLDDAPVPTRTRGVKQPTTPAYAPETPFETDSITEEELLFWSARQGFEEPNSAQSE